MTSSGSTEEADRSWENSEPSLCLIRSSMASSLHLSSPTSAGCCPHLLTAPARQLPLTSVCRSMVPSVCPVTTPWEPISSSPPSYTILPTYGPLSRLLSPKTSQKPTFPVKGQTQSSPLPRCFPNGGHPLSTFCLIATLGWFSAVESHRAYHS